MVALLGIDNGLTVTKAVIFDEFGRQLGVSRKTVPQIKSQPRFVERDMDVVWRKTAAAIKEVIELSRLQADDIHAVSVTAHGDGLYLLDRHCRPLGNGILSLDSRAHAQVDKWEMSGVSEAALKLSGQNPHASAPSAILAWIQANQPERFDNIAHVLSAKDWIRYCLTGVIATDRTEASTSFCDVKTQNYSKDVLALYDLEDVFDALPDTQHSAEICGDVSSLAAQQTGLRYGTPVATGLHDVTASALGVGAHRERTLGIVAGTYSINEVISKSPNTSANWFCRNAIEPGRWNNMAISPSSTANYEWFIKTFCKAENEQLIPTNGSIHDILGPELEDGLARGSSIIFHPYLFGSPMGADASASLFGMRGWHDRGDVIAAILQGIAFNHRDHVDHLKNGFDINRVRLTGGATRNKHVAQLFADVLGQKVETPLIEEAAAWGAALCAGKSVGVFSSLSKTADLVSKNCDAYEPDPNTYARLNQRYQVYRDLSKTMSDSWAKLERIAHDNATKVME